MVPKNKDDILESRRFYFDLSFLGNALVGVRSSDLDHWKVRCTLFPPPQAVKRQKPSDDDEKLPKKAGAGGNVGWPEQRRAIGEPSEGHRRARAAAMVMCARGETPGGLVVGGLSHGWPRGGPGRECGARGGPCIRK